MLVVELLTRPHMQRRRMAAILKSMEEGQWIRNGHDLWGLNERLWEKSPITEEYTHAVQSARSASLHFGSTLVKAHRGNEGARQNHHVFLAFSDGNGGSAELNVMKVEGLARVEGLDAYAQQVVKKFAFGVLVECSVLQRTDLCCEYSDGPGQPLHGAALGPDGPVHMLPSIVHRKQGKEWMEYVVELKDIQASVLTGRFKEDTVYMPYVPMASHA
jgi:hypothetical protein